MAGLVPATHVLLRVKETWVPGIKPGMTPYMSRRAAKSARPPPTRHLARHADHALDPDFHHVAAIEELVAAGADAGRGAGQDQVARVQGEPRRQMGDLLGQVEDHLARIGILLEHIVDPE